MNPSKLIVILIALGFVAGVGVTVALANSPAHPSALEGSHLIMVSQPQAVADVILEAVAAVTS